MLSAHIRKPVVDTFSCISIIFKNVQFNCHFIRNIIYSIKCLKYYDGTKQIKKVTTVLLASYTINSSLQCQNHVFKPSRSRAFTRQPRDVEQ